MCESTYREAIQLGRAREGAKHVKLQFHISHQLFFSLLFPFVSNKHNHFFPAKAAIMQVQRRANFLPWGVGSSRVLGWVTGKGESWAEPEERIRSDKLQRRARMSGQRRAGELVTYK